jgi:hemerythrin-like domain-containing protein
VKRHASLQLFSRDHHGSLVVTQVLIRSAQGAATDRHRAIEDFLKAWSAEISQHLADEERLLTPLMGELDVQRLRKEHATLRALASEADLRRDQKDPPGDWMRRFGHTLEDHIRWEERQLFAIIERAATPEQLQQLGAETRKIESTRPRAQRGHRGQGKRG